MSFEDRINEMGLNDNGDGTFSYSDVHGGVCYKKLSTPHEDIPYLGLFSGPDLENLNFTKTILSNSYYFEGNEVINNIIRENITSGDNSILREETLITKDYCMMYNQVILDNSSDLQVGTVYPVLIVLNSYNGTRKKEISFGISVEGEVNVITGFRHKLGTISQIHSQNHATRMSTVFSDYVDVIQNNITNVVELNFNKNLEDHEILSTLEYIEHFGGKKRRENISTFIQDTTNNDERQLTSWGLFLSILRYSQQEKNLNTKVMMENLAERILELPQRMIDACNRINQ